MLDVGSPTCEATISAELIRLIYNASVRVPSPSGRIDDKKAAESEPLGPEPVVEEVPTIVRDWPAVALRIDGTWPYRFNGLLICHSRAEHPLDDQRGNTMVVKQVSLYLTEDLQVVACAVCHLEGEGTARPVHKVMRVILPDDMTRLLRSVRPLGVLVESSGHLTSCAPSSNTRTMPLLGLAHG